MRANVPVPSPDAINQATGLLATLSDPVASKQMLEKLTAAIAEHKATLSASQEAVKSLAAREAEVSRREGTISQRETNADIREASLKARETEVEAKVAYIKRVRDSVTELANQERKTP